MPLSKKSVMEPPSPSENTCALLPVGGPRASWCVPWLASSLSGSVMSMGPRCDAGAAVAQASMKLGS